MSDLKNINHYVFLPNDEIDKTVTTTARSLNIGIYDTAPRGELKIVNQPIHITFKEHPLIEEMEIPFRDNYIRVKIKGCEWIKMSIPINTENL